MTAERNEVSLHEIEVYRAFLEHPKRWMSNAVLATLVKTASIRTVRAKTQKFVALGLVDQADLFPAHQFRWSEKAKQRNGAYLLRLDRANEVFAEM